MRGLETAAILVTSLLTLAPAALADCATVPGNELPAASCGFESGNPPTGWTLSFGDRDSFAQNTTTFRSGAASGQGGSEPDGISESMYIQSSCFPITAGAGYGFGAFFRVISGSMGGGCEAILRWYSDAAACSSGAASGTQTGSFVPPTTEAWTLATGTATTTGTHARLHLGCFASGTDYVIAMDDAFAGPGMTPVELMSVAVE